MISSAGIGSGLDIENIISSLLAVESQPLIQLQQRKAFADVKISAFGQIQSQLNAFKGVADALKDTTNFNQTTSSSSDTEIVTASASSSKSFGTYSVNVNALAESHILDSAAYTDADTVVGEGNLTITSGSNSFTLTIDSSNSTLAGIRDAINSDTSNTSVSASIINTDAGSRLILSANNTGLSNAIEVTVSGDTDANDTDANGLSNLVYEAAGTQNLTQTQPAADSSVSVNGYTITNASNSVTGIIDDVTFDLKKLGAATVTLSRDTSTVEVQLKSLVNAYNATISLGNQLKSAELSGDNLILNVENSLRGIFNERFLSSDSDLRSVSDLGLSFDRDGILSLDSTKLSAAIDNDFNIVTELFTDTDNGFASQLSNLLDGYTKSGGIVSGRTDGLNTQIDTIDDRIINLDYRLSLTETRLRKQFTALDTLLGTANQTSSFLASELNRLNINNRSNDS